MFKSPSKRLDPATLLCIAQIVPVWIVNGTRSTVTDGKVSSVITTGNPSAAEVLKRNQEKGQLDQQKQLKIYSQKLEEQPKLVQQQGFRIENDHVPNR